MRRILILGGTGAMGKHLVEILVEDKNNDVVVTSRKGRSGGDNLVYVKGDGHDPTFLAQILKEKWDCIVDFMAYTTDEFARRVDLLLDGTARYIFLSSARVYANSSEPLREDSPRLVDACKDAEYLKTDEYALSKARQEDLLFANKRKNWTIIRPYITFSEQRLQLGEMEKEEWLFIALKRGVIPFSHDIAQKQTTLTYARDVAKGMVRLMERDDALGAVYHLTSGQAVTWEQVLATYVEVLERVLGKEIEVLWTERSLRFKRGGMGIYQLVYDRLYDRKFCVEKFECCDKENDAVLKRLALCLEAFLADETRSFRVGCWTNLARYDRENGGWQNILGIPGWKDKLRYLAYRLHLK